MLSIKKVINNNVALVIDSKLQEYIVVGSGIAFKSKKDDIIDESRIEKKFSLLHGEKEKLLEYISDVDFEIISLCEELKVYIESECNTKYTNYMFLSFIDHINGSITRHKLDIQIESEISDEDLKYYEREYQVSRQIGKRLNEELNINLTNNELNFLALHLITYIYDVQFSQINEKVLVITTEILDLIRYKANIEIHDDFNLQRFIVHLKFFVIRQLNDQRTNNEYNDDLYLLLINQYEKAGKILNEIVKYLEQNYGFFVEPNEQMYLLIHLVKIIK